jgi:hypothetical protein
MRATRNEKRRRWESNPRWRICNRNTNPDIAEENRDSGDGAAPGAAVGAKIGAIDADLEMIINRWPTLSDANKAAVVAMFGGADEHKGGNPDNRK